MIDTEKHLNIDITLPWDHSNEFLKLLDERSQIEIYDNKKDIKTRKLKIYTINRVFVFIRDSETNVPKRESGPDGEVYYNSPVSEQEIINGRHNTNFLITPGTLIFSLHFQQQNPSKELVEVAPRVLKETLRDFFPDKEIKQIGSDIYLDNKKISIVDIVSNYSGIFATILINMYYDETTFSKYLTDKDMATDSVKGFTGINNVNPEITMDQVMDLYINKLDKNFRSLYDS